MKAERFYDIYKWDDTFCEQNLGEVIIDDLYLIEVDEPTAYMWYGRRFNPVRIGIVRSDPQTSYFAVDLFSVDDTHQGLWWTPSTLYANGYEVHDAKEKILAWLKRTGWYINIEGFKHYLRWTFGEEDYNNWN